MTEFGALWLQGIHDVDRSVDLDRFAIEQRRSVAPLAYGFDRGLRKVGVDLAVHDPERERPAIHADDSVKDDRTGDPG